MNNNSITLKINGKDVVVEKLPLRKIAEVFKALDKLPAKFTDKLAGTDLKSIPNEKILEILPGIIGDVLPEVAKLISIGSTLTEEEVMDEIGLDEAVEVIVAIFKVNDFSKVFENVKKLMARKPEAESSNKKIGSTGPSIS